MKSWIDLDNVPVHDVCTQTKTPALNRRNIFIRDQYRCQYCAVQMRSSDLTLDHVVPKSKGGKVHHINITYIHSHSHRLVRQGPLQRRWNQLQTVGKPHSLSSVGQD